MSLRAELAENRKHWKGQVFCVIYRFGRLTRRKSIASRILRIPYAVFYKAMTEVVLSLEIPLSVDIGKGVKIRHGFGIVVHANASIGENVTLRQGVTIGAKHTGDHKAPKIGNNVEFGANSIVIGDISIGDNTIIAAGSVIYRDIPPNSIAYGSEGKFRPRKAKN